MMPMTSTLGAFKRNYVRIRYAVAMIQLVRAVNIFVLVEIASDDDTKAPEFPEIFSKSKFDESYLLFVKLQRNLQRTHTQTHTS